MPQGGKGADLSERATENKTSRGKSSNLIGGNRRGRSRVLGKLR